VIDFVPQNDLQSTEYNNIQRFWWWNVSWRVFWDVIRQM